MKAYIFDIRDAPQYDGKRDEESLEERRYPIEGDSIGSTDAREVFSGLDHIVSFTEDKEDVQIALQLSALKYLDPEQTPFILCAPSVREGQRGLKRFQEGSPTAQSHTVLDYDMSANAQGEKKPTEAYFHEAGPFLQLMANGGVAIFYTGHPDQAISGSAVANYFRENEKFALFFGTKGHGDNSVKPDDVIKAIRLAIENPEVIPFYRQAADEHAFNLAAIKEIFR